MTSDVHELHTTSITTPSDTEIRIERSFDAPREVLWEMYTDPELLKEWLGPRDLTMTVGEMDVRPGGSYRFTHRDPAGNEYVFFGEFREVVAPELLVRTFQFEGMPGSSLERAEFEELEGGRTRVVATATYSSKEARDGMLQSGMDRGVLEGHARLDELLARRPSQS
jgi:uncharacterized protein YndB with AHSA1/START domain